MDLSAKEPLSKAKSFNPILMQTNSRVVEEVYSEVFLIFCLHDICRWITVILFYLPSFLPHVGLHGVGSDQCFGSKTAEGVGHQQFPCCFAV